MELSLFKKTDVVGLDIGSNSIKLIQMQQTKKGWRLLNLGIIQLPPEAIVDGSIIDSMTVMSAVKDLEYKEAARDIVSILRDARSRAISSNLEHRVEFNVANRQYRMTQGNRAAGSTNNFATVIKDWGTLPAGVNMAIAFGGGGSNMKFNPNGTSGSGNVTILDSNNTIRFTITVVSIGRVRIS